MRKIAERMFAAIFRGALDKTPRRLLHRQRQERTLRRMARLPSVKSSHWIGR